MNTQQLEVLFKDLGIIQPDTTNNGSVLLHGTTKPSSVVDDCFKGGLHKKENASVLSTIMLNNDQVTNISTEKMVAYNYGCDENEIIRTVVVHFPKTLGNMYLGNVYINEGERNGNSGLQNGKHCMLDCLLTDTIPAEFIVGVIERNQNEEDFEFKINPNYYGINAESEAKITAEITEKVSQHPAYSMFTGLTPLSRESANIFSRIFTDMGFFSDGGLYNFAKDLIVHQASPDWLNEELSNLVKGAFETSKSGNYVPQYLLVGTPEYEEESETYSSDKNIDDELERLKALLDESTNESAPNTFDDDNDFEQ